MTHNPQNYGWPSRSSQPLQPPSMAVGQPAFAPPHSMSSSAGYPAYGHQLPPSQSFYPPGAPSSHYLLPQARQQPRSSSISYSYPSSSLANSPSAMHDHPFTLSPPSYLMNQSEYYLTPSSSISSVSNSSSIAVSPQPPNLMPPSTVYSSPDSVPASSDPEQQVRVISFRPKPQCWDHGCNGREFSTFSNLLRHQREKSGVVAKAECPSCGAVFTRTTARNIHVAQGKCKGGGRDMSAE
ncbi:hypothetical protein BDW42DRAFT_185233 [Aspergillus taichungensis]|uniref:C2H2-type domain-containing protein n=1 Tax=Aspergillus taichungensis TaxID=482145 RepID=A0A2J5HWN8_9EURO|nr:hypothetical protein BDW42DRAFT_185233 [Aspergillus taichungensis]